MRRPPAVVLVLAVAASLLTVGNAAVGPEVRDCGPGVQTAYVDGLVLCTHNDEPPAGVDTTQLPSTDELWEERFGVESSAVGAAAVGGDDAVVAAAGSVACVGDGTSGPRVQLVYARAGDVTGRYGSVAPLIRQYAADADDIINASAGRVGDGRRIRYVTNSSCEPKVLNVTLSKTGDDGFANTVSELRAQGLTDVDRKYLVFIDAAVGICGLGEVYMDDRSGQDNPNNSGRAMYARVDTACWRHAAAHELIHTFGAVQNSAPNSSGAGHCTDEVDVMCYRDTASTVTRQVCSRAGQVDCNNDDYFHPNPKASSYLDRKWNTANSRFLTGSAPPPPPAAGPTTVTVPSSGPAGVPWPVSVAAATPDARVVWSSTLSECRFADTRASETTWTCPADVTGAAEVTAYVTEDGVTVPHSTPVEFTVSATQRELNAELIPSTRKLRAGRTMSLTGRLTDAADGRPVSGVTVVFRGKERGGDGWTTLGSALSNDKGQAGIAVRPRRNVRYRVLTLATPTWERARSARTLVKVRTKVTREFKRTTVKPRRTIVLAGKVSPDKVGKIIRLRRYKSKKGRWVTIREKRVRADSTYRFKVTPRKSGIKVRLRVVKPRDRYNLRGRTGRTVVAVQ